MTKSAETYYNAHLASKFKVAYENEENAYLYRVSAEDRCILVIIRKNAETDPAVTIDLPFDAIDELYNIRLTEEPQL
jgi:hypothetical protein